MSHSGSTERLSVSKSKNLSFSGKQAAREILLLATSAVLSPEAREKISTILNGNVDWQYLLDLAEYHGVGPLLSYNLLHGNFSGGVPGPYAEKLNAKYHNNLYKNVILADELNKALTAFGKSNIPVIVLKGVTLAELLYNNPGLRVVSDMDIIVPVNMIDTARALITELGYGLSDVKKSWKHPFHDIPYCKQARLPVFIELHRNLDDPSLVNIPLDDIWKRAQSFQMQGTASLLLSPEDTLLYLSGCFVKPSNFNLKTLGDITELLKKYNGLLDWDYILKSARSWQVYISLTYTLKMARSLLRAPVPDTVTKTLMTGFFRSFLLRLLINRDTFISPIKWNKLRIETLVLHYSLMMDRPGQVRAVLSRFRGPRTKVPWLRTAMWILFVVFTALARYITNPVSKK
jgi:hypothetical protein